MAAEINKMESIITEAEFGTSDRRPMQNMLNIYRPWSSALDVCHRNGQRCATRIQPSLWWEIATSIGRFHYYSLPNESLHSSVYPHQSFCVEDEAFPLDNGPQWLWGRSLQKHGYGKHVTNGNDHRILSFVLFLIDAQINKARITYGTSYEPGQFQPNVKMRLPIDVE